MKFKLLAYHVIDDELMAPGRTIERPPGFVATVFMEGLDTEAEAAVEYAKLLAFGRYPWPYGLYPPQGRPLDDPPIPRPLQENQPVYHFVGAKEYLS